jgi:hypothetical protein
VTAYRPSPERHWRSYGDDKLPTPIPASIGPCEFGTLGGMVSSRCPTNSSAGPAGSGSRLIERRR